MHTCKRAFTYLFTRDAGPVNQFIARWVFLRFIGIIYFSAFFALLFQIRGLIGSQGILPAADYLQALHRFGTLRFWYAPSLAWISSGDSALLAICWIGLLASICVLFNLLPRLSLLLCWLCFLSFIGVSQEFGQYQSDGMLLEAGFLALFIAPAGLWPGFGSSFKPIRAAILLLLWEWFRIYFESGVVKLQSGDPTWRNLTAMYEYYQNGPLPTWIGWYLQHLPHSFHIATAAITLIMELLLVWLALLSRRLRIVCFWIVTLWQAGVILTANYAFLNYLVLALGFLLLDDAYLLRFVPHRWRMNRVAHPETSAPRSAAATPPATLSHLSSVALEPFRIANQFGLFATMTPHRYEIEFQGSNDAQTWISYPFRYKPQDPAERPGIYAPYQPRFDWNLWFASLEDWQESPMVPLTEERLLQASRPVLSLFRSNPFPDRPPRYVRAILWQYWFSTPQQKRTTGVWWQRQLLGTFAPTVQRLPDGTFVQVSSPDLSGPPSD